MILIVSIILSNGDKVVYEFGEEIFVHSHIIKNENSGYNEITTISFVNGDKKYTISTNSGIKEIVEGKQSNYKFDWENKSVYYENLNSFQIGDYEGQEFIYRDTSGVTVGHFYIKIPELQNIYNQKRFSNSASFLDNWLLLANLDVCDPGQRILNRPTDIKIVWNDSFSVQTLESIKDLDF